MNASDILNKPLTEIAGSLRDGAVSAADLAEAAIARHEAVGATFNAYLTWNADVPRKMAAAADAALAAGSDLGPLQGLPISIKDLYGIQGFPTFAGSGKPLPEKWEAEGPVVQGIKAQLGVITGKTHTVEFAAGGALAGRLVGRRRGQPMGRLGGRRFWLRHHGLGAHPGVHHRHRRAQNKRPSLV